MECLGLVNKVVHPRGPLARECGSVLLGVRRLEVSVTIAKEVVVMDRGRQ